MKKEEKNLILNRLERLIKHDLLSDEATKEIDKIIIEDLEG